MKIHITFILILLLSSCSGLPLPSTKSLAKRPTTDQPAPNRSELLAIFEQKIARSLINDLNQYPSPLTHSRQSREQQLQYLRTMTAQINKLNPKLLGVKTRIQLGQVKHLQAAVEAELENWHDRLQMRQVKNLIPEAVFEPLDIKATDELFKRHVYPKIALERLKKLSIDRAPRLPAHEARTENLANTFTLLSQDRSNPIIEGFKTWLQYSPLPQAEQIKKFEQQRGLFETSTLPRLEEISRALSKQQDLTKPNHQSSSSSSSNQQLLSEQLQTRLNDITERLSQTITTEKLKTIYQPSLGQTPSGQIPVGQRAENYHDSLSLIGYFAEEIVSQLQLNFPIPTQAAPSQALLVIGHTSETGPLHVYTSSYETGYANFDLRQVSQLPRFELALLGYQYLLPGEHLSALHQPLIRDELEQVAIFRKGWSLYSLNILAETGGLETENMMMAHLVRTKLNICLAIADLKVNNGLWNSETAVNFLVAQTPYPASYLHRQIEDIIQRPGLAIGGLVLSLELESLREFAQAQKGLSLKQWHSRILQAGPMSLNYLKHEFRRELKSL